MRSLFNMDGPLFEFLNKMADLIILNLLFIICCIPIITIGDSFTAMAYVLLKKKEGSEGYIWKQFFHSFKENFRQSTIIWVFMMIGAFILYVDFRMLNQFQNPFKTVMLVVIMLGVFFWLVLAIYAFPLQSRFENPIKQTVQNAILMSLANAPKTILLIAITLAAGAITLWNTYTIVWGVLFWIMIGFALIQEINCRFLHKMFKVLMPENLEEEMTPGEFSWEKEEAAAAEETAAEQLTDEMAGYISTDSVETVGSIPMQKEDETPLTGNNANQ